MTLPLFCAVSGHEAHSELVALGHKAAEYAIERVREMGEGPAAALDTYTLASAVQQTVIDAYMVPGHPELRALIAEIEKHARVRVAELNRIEKENPT